MRILDASVFQQHETVIRMAFAKYDISFPRGLLGIYGPEGHRIEDDLATFLAKLKGPMGGHDNA